MAADAGNRSRFISRCIIRRTRKQWWGRQVLCVFAVWETNATRARWRQLSEECRAGVPSLHSRSATTKADSSIFTCCSCWWCSPCCCNWQQWDLTKGTRVVCGDCSRRARCQWAFPFIFVVLVVVVVVVVFSLDTPSSPRRRMVQWLRRSQLHLQRPYPYE